MTIKNKLKNLVKLSNEELGYYLINKDLLSNKIKEKLKPKLIKKSIETGQKEAKDLLNKYENFTIEDIIKSMDIEILNEESDNRFNYIYMGVFEEPDKIFLYEENIREAESLAKKYREVLGNERIKNIILAHEIFHVVEFKNPSLYTNTIEIELFKIGPFKRKSKLLSLGEIAAMEFTKVLLDLNYNPVILDFLFMNIWNQEEADNLYNKIMSYRR